MPQCAKCGKAIPRKTAIFKVMQTGKCTDGSAFKRPVNLCPTCAAQAEQQEKTRQKQKLFLLLVLVLAVVGGACGWLFLRSH